MTILEPLSVGALLGVANAAHCAGMCGGFAAALGSTLSRSVGYVVGKTATYGLLGAIAGLAGREASRAITQVSGVLGLVTAALLLLAAWRLWTGRRVAAPGSSSLAKLLAPLWQGQRSSLAVGATTGLLPCGVVYLGVADAASRGDPFSGWLVMTGLGFGTAPVLVLIAFGGRSLLARFGARRLARVGALLLVMTAALALLRSLGPSLAPEGAPPKCPACH